MHGICYWTSNTTKSEPLDINIIDPFRQSHNAYIWNETEKHFYHKFGELGLSVHITENNEDILIGAPGIYMWKGSVIRHHPAEQDDFQDLGRSRRDTAGAKVEYISEVPNPSVWNQEDYSYFGYAVSSGLFFGPQESKMLYVASAPRDNQSGKVGF